MKRSYLFSMLLTVFIAFACMLFVSCSQDLFGADESEPDQSPVTDVETPSADNTISKSLSSLKPGDSIEFKGINADTEITLSDFTLEDGVIIEIVSDESRGFSDYSRDIQSDVLFRRQDGTLIPIPDELGCAKFVAAAIGVAKDAEVIIRKLDKLDMDLEISGDEYPDRNGLVEEYYYINFLLDPRFRNLDPSEIVLVKSGTVGAQGIAVLQSGMLNSDTDGVLNFSRKWFTGFAVNMHIIYDPEYRDKIKLNVLNPIHAGTTAKTLTNDVNVIMVEKQQTSSEYKVVVSFSGENTAEVIRNIANDYKSLQLSPRYVNDNNGRFRKVAVVPVFDLENRTITYHLGSVNEDLLFNLDYDSEVTGFVAGSATVVLEEDNDGMIFHDLAELDDVDYISAQSAGIITWAFRSDSEVILEGNVCVEARPYVGNRVVFGTSDSGQGTSGSVRRIACDNGTGFVLIDYTGDTEMNLIELRKTQKQSIECAAVEWDPDSLAYVCVDDDCEICAELGEKKHYSRPFIIENESKIFKTRYVTSDSFGVYGKICYGSGLYISVENVELGGGTTGGRGGNYPMGTRTWNENNTDLMVIVELTGVYKNPDMITCNIAIDGTEAFAMNVPMYPIKSNVDKLEISGTPVAQYEFAACDPEGLTVTAVYEDETNADVTDKVEFSISSGSDTWGSGFGYTNGYWHCNFNNKIVASYFDGNGTRRVKTQSIILHNNNGPNTHQGPYILQNQSDSFIVLDTIGFKNVAEPFALDDNGDLTGGYLYTETAEAGSDALMIFTYDQYSNETSVDLETFYGLIGLFGAKLNYSEESPGFDWYSTNEGDSAYLAFSVNGEGVSESEAVVVYGTLVNTVNGSISISDFDPETTQTYFIKLQ